MKKFTVVYCLLVVIAVAFIGCYRDVINPGTDPNGPPQNVSFSGDVAPIFVKNCALSGCHDAVPAHKPALTADKVFNSLTTGGYVNTLVPAESKIYMIIKGGAMPPSGALKSGDVQKVLDWIRNGALNN
jgi:hypothetical protein